MEACLIYKPGYWHTFFAELRALTEEVTMSLK
jgi:hypothetical protein